MSICSFCLWVHVIHLEHAMSTLYCKNNYGPGRDKVTLTTCIPRIHDASIHNCPANGKGKEDVFSLTNTRRRVSHMQGRIILSLPARYLLTIVAIVSRAILAFFILLFYQQTQTISRKIISVVMMILRCWSLLKRVP